MPDNPYAEFGGTPIVQSTEATPNVSAQDNPYAEFGGTPLATTGPASSQPLMTQEPSSNPYAEFGGTTLGGSEADEPSQEPSSGSGWEFANKARQIWNSDESTVGKIWDTANTPLIDLKRDGAHGVEAGAENVLSGFTSPLSAALTLATFGVGGLAENLGLDVAKMATPEVLNVAKTVGKLAAAGFTGMQLKGVADASPYFIQAIKNGDTDKALEIGTELTAQLGLAGLGVKQGLHDMLGTEDSAKATPKDLLVGDYNKALKNDDVEANTINAAIKKAVPSQAQRDALQLYGEAAGDKDKLAAQQKAVEESRNIKSPALQRQTVDALKRAQNLTPDETAKIQDLREMYDSDLDRGADRRLFTTEGRNNYFARARWNHEPEETENVDNAKQILGSGSQDHTQRRIFETTVDGILNGYEPVKNKGRYVMDAADVAADYHRAIGRAVAKQDFVNSALAMRGTDQRPLAVPGGNMGVFDKTEEDENGNPVPTGEKGKILNSNNVSDHPLNKNEYGVLSGNGKLQDMIDRGIIVDRGPRPDIGAATIANEEVPYIPVTDAMRDSVMNEGQSLFNKSRVSAEGSVNGPSGEYKIGELRKDTDGKQTLWLGPEAMGLVHAGIGGDPGFETRGASLTKADIDEMLPYLNEVVDEKNLDLIGGKERAETASQLSDLLIKARNAAGKEGVVVIGNTGRGIGRTVSVAREEYDHRWQKSLSEDGKLTTHLDAGTVKDLWRAIPMGAHAYFDDNGYTASPLGRVIETSAKLLSGRQKDIGVSDEDAAEFLGKYLDAVVDKHGEGALDTLKHVVGVAKQIREERIGNGAAEGVPVGERAAGGAGSAEAGQTAGLREEAAGGAGGGGQAKPEGVADDGYYHGRYRFNTEGYDNSIRNRFTSKRVYGGDENTFLNAPVAFHPEIAKQAKLILAPERSWLQQNPVTSKILNLSTQAKQSLLSLSGFHWVQIGLRGVESGVNPFKPMLEMSKDVGGWDMTNPRHLRLLEAGGIQPGLTEGANTFSEGLRGHGIVSKIPGVGRVVDSVNDSLFGPNGFIDRMKLNSALHFADRLERTNPKMDEMTRYKIAGQLANQRFGGLNYLAMGRSPVVRDIMRLTMLAPDWMESNARDFASALGPYGGLTRFDLARIALYNFAAAQTINMLNTGKMHLDTPFGVQSKDGQKVYMVRTMPTDIWHALTAPMDYASNRLNPVISRTAIEAITGRDKQGHLRDLGDQIKDLITNVTPIPLQGAMNKVTGNFHPGESSGDYVRSAAGLSTKPNNSPAESLAYKLASENSSGRTPSQQAESFHRVIGYEDRLRGGDQSALQDMQKDLQTGQISLTQYAQIIAGRRMSRLQAVVNRLPMSDALDVWDLSTNEEREKLAPVVARKMQSYRTTEAQKLTPSERAQMDVRLAKTVNDIIGSEKQ